MSINLNTTPDEFVNELKKVEGQVIVDFWAAWCGPCRMLSPILDKIEEENENVTIVKINVDENQELSAALRISSIPTMMFYRDGVQNKSTVIGVLPKHVIEEHIVNG